MSATVASSTSASNIAVVVSFIGGDRRDNRVSAGVQAPTWLFGPARSIPPYFLELTNCYAIGKLHGETDELYQNYTKSFKVIPGTDSTCIIALAYVI